MNRVDDFLESIKGQQPELEGADALTDAIMARIAAEPQVKRDTARQRTLFGALLQGTASAAAVVAIALFLAGSTPSPLEENVPSGVKNNNMAYLAGVEQCRSAADVCALYFKPARQRKSPMNSIATLKNMYYGNNR